jgi:uncharacterized protein
LFVSDSAKLSILGDSRLLAMVLHLVDGLRISGVGTSLGDAIDATTALTHIDLLDRSLLRTALGATLISRAEDLAVFDVLFEQCFPLTPASDSTDPSNNLSRSSEADQESKLVPDAAVASADIGHRSDGDDQFHKDLAAAVQNEDADLRSLANEAIQRFSGIGERTASERYFLQRVLRALDLAQVLVDAVRVARLGGEELDALALRQRRDDINARLDVLKQMLAEEIRRQLFADVGVTGVGLIAPRRIEDAPVLEASKRELDELRRAIRPLAVKLARRLARQRRKRGGAKLDMRRTVRRSIATGGVPSELVLRRKNPAKPDIVVLCDISGSVAEFAHFTLMLLQALASELRGLRTFVFVDGVAEITSVLQGAQVDLDPRLLVTLPGVVVDDGHSDYEAALSKMLSMHTDALGPGTTVIVTGDGRTNYRNPGVESLRVLRKRVERVYWFNPEPRDNWTSHDSCIQQYSEHCDGVYEVRTLAQLSSAVEHVL